MPNHYRYLTRHRAIEVQVTCAHCGKSILKESPVVNRSLSKIFFCDRSCSLAYRQITPDKFWAMVDRSGECWIWHGWVNKGGYGSVYFQGVPWFTHRLAWHLTNGAIPEGLQICHTCDVNYPAGDRAYRRCCNPKHLEAGTGKGNMRHAAESRRSASGDRSNAKAHPETMPRGEHHGMSKLTDESVREILASSGTQRALAARFGVSPRTIHNIRHRLIWQHVS